MDASLSKLRLAVAMIFRSSAVSALAVVVAISVSTAWAVASEHSGGGAHKAAGKEAGASGDDSSDSGTSDESSEGSDPQDPQDGESADEGGDTPDEGGDTPEDGGDTSGDDGDISGGDGQETPDDPIDDGPPDASPPDGGDEGAMTRGDLAPAVECDESDSKHSDDSSSNHNDDSSSKHSDDSSSKHSDDSSSKLKSSKHNDSSSDESESSSSKKNRHHAAGNRHRRADNGCIPGQYIVVYKNSAGNVDAETSEREKKDGFKSRLRYKRALKGFAAKLSHNQVTKLQADPDVDFISADRKVSAAGTVPLASGEPLPPTGVRRMQAASSTSVHEASNVSVAVIDTGIDLDHPDLNAASGTNCINSGAAPEDDVGHGTHVAGTIAAKNNGSGVVGVAPGTKVYAVKVLDANGGTTSTVACGIDWVTANAASKGIKVANMSLGGAGDPVQSCSNTSDAMHVAICNSTNAGVTYVVAAGNSGWDFDFASAPDVPAAYPQVLTVAAASDSDGQSGGSGGAPTCDKGESDDRYASFSNFAATSGGAAHTIAAPGVCIRSTWLNGGYNTISGTSMASPHVAGAVALCLNDGGTNGPCAGKSPSDIITKLRSDAKDHTDANHGFGFSGDPVNSPLSGRYFGYLDWVGLSGTTPPPGGSTASPSSVGVVNGTIVSGNASRLGSADGDVVTVRGGKKRVSWYGQFSGVPVGLSSVTLEYTGRNDKTCSQTLSLYNWTTKTYSVVDTRSVGTVNLPISVGLSSSLTGFVSSTGALRVLVTCNGKRVLSSGDLMRITY